jgi:hypothetical protein
MSSRCEACPAGEHRWEPARRFYRVLTNSVNRLRAELFGRASRGEVGDGDASLAMVALRRAFEGAVNNGAAGEPGLM